MRKGFTLAEVLITLGIIGVVAAMTIPTVINDYKKQAYVTQLRKTYNEISQALIRYRYDNSITTFSESNFDPQELMNNYFKNVKECDNVLSCFANNYKTIKNGTIGINHITHSYILANGTSVRIYKKIEGNKIANIMVDTNGHKGPNKLGRDLFFIALYKTGLMDDFAPSLVPPLSLKVRESMFQSQCIGQGEVNGWGCFGKILNDNWQMNY